MPPAQPHRSPPRPRPCLNPPLPPPLPAADAKRQPHGRGQAHGLRPLHEPGAGQRGGGWVQRAAGEGRHPRELCRGGESSLSAARSRSARPGALVPGATSPGRQPLLSRRPRRWGGRRQAGGGGGVWPALTGSVCVGCAADRGFGKDPREEGAARDVKRWWGVGTWCPPRMMSHVLRAPRAPPLRLKRGIWRRRDALSRTHSARCQE